MTENLLRYFRWQARDFLRERGIALLIIGLLLGSMVTGPMLAMGAEIDAVAARRILLQALLPQTVFISTFIALNGLISTDRKAGYYRFLFSKPVSIPAYYVQKFIVALLGFLVVLGVLLAVFAALVRPVEPWTPLLFGTLVFLSLGGIGFLISSLFRRDWPVLAAVYLGSAFLHTIWDTRQGWRRLALHLLPPLNRLDPAAVNLYDGRGFDGQLIGALLGYSAICFIAGVLVLRRRPIG